MPQTSSPRDLGYTLYAPRRASEPGHAGVEVVFRTLPSGLHFDPEWATLWVVSDSGGMDSLMVEHPWLGDETYRVCAGQVDIGDRRGHKLDIFTFGGELSFSWTEAQTSMRLVSPAPILVSFRPHSVPAVLAEEVEIALAQRRAAWGEDTEAFARRLAAVKPLSLYVACLAEILQRWEQFPRREGFGVQFKHALQLELTDVHSEVGVRQTLEDLL
jgi:hypothetical protein